MSWPASAEVLAPLGAWFEAVRRDLPWRARDLDAPHPDPWAVLVSEAMLQQTRVATVVPYFERWMREFPDPAALAGASAERLHKLWEGLGYYRRARHLQAAAAQLVERGWPDDIAGLLALPGLGPYTAAAVAAIAFQLPEPALDGNGFRVASRLLALADPRAKSASLREWLRPALAAHGPSRTTQGLMELGAAVCLPRQPRCQDCPLAAGCAVRALGQPDAYPLRRPRAAPRQVQLWLGAIKSGNRWLLERPRADGLLAGLWRWPAVEVRPPAAGAAERTEPYGSIATGFEPWVQIYTHRRELVHPFAAELLGERGSGSGREWIEAERLATLPMGRRDQRLRAMVLGSEPALSTVRVPPEAVARVLDGC